MFSNTPDFKTSHDELTRILSIRLELQPGFSCVAIDIVGIKLWLYKVCSNSLFWLNRSILKSPRTTVYRVQFFPGRAVILAWTLLDRAGLTF